MANIKIIKQIISIFKNAELIDIIMTEKRIQITLRDYLDKGQDFIQDCKAIETELFDYVLNGGNRGYTTFKLSNNEEYCILSIFIE